MNMHNILFFHVVVSVYLPNCLILLGAGCFLWICAQLVGIITV